MGAVATLVVVLGIVVVIYGLMERAKAQRVTKAPFVKTGQVNARARGTAVSVEGNVACAQPLVAPFSGTRCLYYSIKCTAEWKAGETKKTKVLSSSKSAAQFTMDDGSGPVFIDASEGGTFEPTQKKSETKGAGLIGSLTGKDLKFGEYVVSAGALDVGTKYRVDEEVLPLGPRMYACGDANGTVIGAPSGMRSLILSHRSRDDLLSSAFKTSKLALAGGVGGIAVGTMLGVASRLIAPPSDAGSPAVASETPNAAATTAGATAAPTSAVALAAPAADPNTASHVAPQHHMHEPSRPEVKPVAIESSIKIEPPKPKAVTTGATKAAPAGSVKPK